MVTKEWSLRIKGFCCSVAHKSAKRTYKTQNKYIGNKPYRPNNSNDGNLFLFVGVVFTSIIVIIVVVRSFCWMPLYEITFICSSWSTLNPVSLIKAFQPFGMWYIAVERIRVTTTFFVFIRQEIPYSPFVLCVCAFVCGCVCVCMDWIWMKLMNEIHFMLQRKAIFLLLSLWLFQRVSHVENASFAHSPTHPLTHTGKYRHSHNRIVWNGLEFVPETLS